MLKILDLLAPVNTGIPHADVAWAQIQKLVKTQFLSVTAEWTIELFAPSSRLNGLRIAHRNTRGRALSDMFGQRWRRDVRVEHIRVRTCRGIRR